MSALGWHPIDVGGLRLYQVTVTWPRDWGTGRRSEYVVAGKSPTDAAERVARIYQGAVESPVVKGRALNVLQPEVWWNEGIPAFPPE